MRKTSSIRSKNARISLYTSNLPKKSKLEGFDISIKSLKKKNINNKKIDKIKKKVKKTQKKNEYIKSLQNEVKILDYEMGIMKNKENEKKNELKQMNKFFEDGIPINNNILGLKSQYQILREKGENEILENEGIFENLVFEENDLKNLNLKLLKLKMDLENEILKKRDFLGKEEILKKGLIFDLENFKVKKDKDLEILFEMLKKKNEENLKINRNFEKKKISDPKKKKDEKIFLENLKRKIKQREKIILEEEKICEDLLKKINLDFFKNEEEKKNFKLESKLLQIEKSIEVNKSRIKEIRLILESRKFERENKEKNLKKILFEISKKKEKIEKLQDFSNLKFEDEISKIENLKIKELEKKIEKVIKEIQFYIDRRIFEENEIEKFGNKKINLKSNNLDFEHFENNLKRDEFLIFEKIQNLKKEKEILIFQKNKLVIDIPVLKENCENFENEIPILKKKIFETKKILDNFEKQIEFANQIKNLEMNDLKISYNSNNQVNENLCEFLKNYENLKNFNNF